MLWFSKTKIGPIGIDIGTESLKMAQLKMAGRATSLLAGASALKPSDIEYGSVEWQRWAIEAIGELMAKNKFKGKNIAATVPASEVFVDHIKMPKLKDNSGKAMEDAILGKIKSKLPIGPSETVIRHQETEQGNCLVIAIEREKVDRLLAVYEKTNLRIKSMAVWPTALTSTYTKFFCRRNCDIDSVVIMLDIEERCSNFIISRHKNPLFVHSIPIGAESLESVRSISKLTGEITACRRTFGSMYKRVSIDRMIFLSGKIVDEEICKKIAQQLELPAHIGDCLAAVDMPACEDGVGIDRRECNFSVATAFGLGLS